MKFSLILGIKENQLFHCIKILSFSSILHNKRFKTGMRSNVPQIKSTFT
jgi:hypothetical protein